MQEKSSPPVAAKPPHLLRAVTKEIIANLLLILPIALVIGVGWFATRTIESRLSCRTQAELHVLCTTCAEQEIRACPALRNQELVRIESIDANARNQREVEYQYRVKEDADIHRATALFVRTRHQWKAAQCQ
jgi:hypothetical protein